MRQWYLTGKKIKQYRMLRGYTQKDLGIMLGYKTESAGIRVAQYESGTRNVKATAAEQIANILNIPLGEVFVDVDRMIEIGTKVDELFGYQDTNKLIAQLTHLKQEGTTL